MLTRLRKFWKSLGPGVITGAADDDPAGIAIYAMAGAKFGLLTLWTSLVTLPFMIVIQRMAGRIGLVSGRGLAGNMKRYYPKWILAVITVLICVATIINIGADISAMAAALNLLVPFPPVLLAILISFTIILLLILMPYHSIAFYLKWVASVLFAYVVAALLIDQPWKEVTYRLFVPHFSLDKEYIGMIVAIFGTTISPYLFFWQASETVEELRESKEITAAMIPDVKPHGPHRSSGVIRNEIGTMYKDVYFGMIFSNMITFFIMILAASTLFKNGFTNVTTIDEIASILEPLAGNYAHILFLIGIIASGILAIPVLAGSAAYALAEIFGWNEGFNNNFGKAKQFYLIIILATLMGIAIPLLGLQAVNILYFTGILFGIVSPFLILMVIHMANNPKIMGRYTSRRFSNIIAYGLFIIISGSLIMMMIQ